MTRPREIVRFAIVLLAVSASGCEVQTSSAAPGEQSAQDGTRAERRPRFNDEDYAAHIRALREKLPEGDFHIVESRPFVVIGDESREAVERRAERTVNWAVTHLHELYFPREPNRILDVWLFKNEESYRKYTKEIFNDEPTTPFGYYSRRHRALIMNIGTGGGTLVHEIVHPFMEANFPQCPSWFNEGLASLYEQSGERDGKIVGFTNWRLRGLQQTIERGRLRSLESLLQTSTQEFYGEGSGTNYAQARYLCYYLQQHGLLQKFYHQFREEAEDDPTGLKTLRSVLGTDDLNAFQEKWEAYTAELVFE